MVSTTIDNTNPKNAMVSTSIDSSLSTKKKSTGRKKIEIKKIEKTSSLQVTFSKRRTGLFKKASELCVLTGAKIAIFVNSPSDRMYVFGHPDVDDLIEKHLQAKNNDNVQKKGSNQSYEELLHEFDVENMRNEMSASSGSNYDDEGLGLGFDECIEGMGLGELENYLCKLQEAKYDVEYKANELMFDNIYQG